MQAIGIVDGPWKAGLVIAKLGQCTRKVDQVLAEGPQGLRTDLAAQDDLPFQDHGDDQMGYLDGTLLEQTTDERVGLASTSFRI